MVSPDLPDTTLFMLMSVDGKISTGAHDERDFEKDLPTIAGANIGLSQYYELGKKTDLASFCTGRTMSKIGWNEINVSSQKVPLSFVVVDNKPHLRASGVENIAKHAQKLYLLTSNRRHPAFNVSANNIEVIEYDRRGDFVHLFRLLKAKGIDFITIQSGGEMNAQLLRLGLINRLSVVIAPILVGGRHTPTLIDGESLRFHADLQHVKSLELVSVKQLANSYLNVEYMVS